MIEGLRLRFDWDICHLAYKMVLVDHRQDKTVAVAKVEWVPIDASEGSPIESQLSVGEESFKCFGRALMDDLWRAGFRPTDAGSVNGELSATKDALARERELMDRILPAALRKG